ncbi:MAG: hypothetical protein CMJ94_13625 [Planctomycetes bacterium]|nr:hypothetical protein [Planctomycetota bacterium]
MNWSFLFLAWTLFALPAASQTQDPPVLIWPEGRVEPDMGYLRSDGVIEDLGGARGTCGAGWVEARLIRTMEGLELRGEFRNESASPLWWRPVPGGSYEEEQRLLRWGGDILSHGPVTPVWTEDGWLERAYLAPGSSRSFRVLLCDLSEGDSEDWAWAGTRPRKLQCTLDWYLPCRVAPEALDTFAKTKLTVRWELGRQPSLQCNGEEASDAGHFTRTGHIPFQLGPLSGHARLEFRREGAWVIWELENRSVEEIRFQLVRDDEPWRWELPATPGMEITWYARRAFLTEFPEVPVPAGAASGHETWAPGEQRSGRFLLRDLGDPSQQRWQLWIPSTWPSDSQLQPRPTWLRLHWHEDRGVCLVPERPVFEDVPLYEQHRRSGRLTETSTLTMVHDWPMLVEADANGFHVDLAFLQPSNGEEWYWSQDGHSDLATLWVSPPESMSCVIHIELPRKKLPGRPLSEEEAADLRMTHDVWITGAIHEESLSESQRDLLWSSPLSSSWEAWTAIPFPRADSPSYEYDFPMRWVVIRYDPKTGIHVSEL